MATASLKRRLMECRHANDPVPIRALRRLHVSTAGIARDERYRQGSRFVVEVIVHAPVVQPQSRNVTFVPQAVPAA